MLFSVRPSLLVASAFTLLTVASPAFAATVGHQAPRQPIASEAAATATDPASALPYSCAKSELNTRLEKRTCL